MMVIFWLLLVIFVLVCVVICFLVLIQSDKGGGISGAIGGGLGGASSLLGTQDTANILTRGTMIFGGGFFILCIIMSFVMSKQTVTVEKSLLQKRAEKQQSFSPSSVLDRGGLPIRESQSAGSAPGAANALPTAGLPITKSPSEPEPASKQVPVGAIPIGPPKQGAKK
ncbi:MAG: preprotein translocase subunit SecG [Chitinispirillaceae bacterium]|jgi:preprotein translocase subunit SecG